MRPDFFCVALIVVLTSCAAPVQPTSFPNPVIAPYVVTTFRDALKDGGDGPLMAWIPVGTFTMGDLQGHGIDYEVPPRTITIAEPFAMGAYEVTFEEYDRFCDATGRAKANDWNWGRGTQPVVMVDWFDAVAYTEWLSAQTGKHYRLPTEAEWEYAARAGTNTDYWWGNDIGQDRASCYDCGVASSTARHPLPAGTFAPNPFGVYDTVGNLWEWTASRWSPKFNGDEQQPVDKKNVPENVAYYNSVLIAMRGGSWHLHHLDSRASSRYYSAPQARTIYHGFRVARSR